MNFDCSTYNVTDQAARSNTTIGSLHGILNYHIKKHNRLASSASKRALRQSRSVLGGLSEHEVSRFFGWTALIMLLSILLRACFFLVFM
jgi:hypothetical protein